MIVDLPMKHGYFPVRYVNLPGGKSVQRFDTMPWPTVQERIDNIYDVLSEGQQAMMLQDGGVDSLMGQNMSKPYNEM